MRLLFFDRLARDKSLEALRADLLCLTQLEGFTSHHGNQLEPEDINEWIEEIALYGECRQCFEQLRELEDSLSPKKDASIIESVRQVKAFYRAVCMKSKHVSDMEHAACENMKARKRRRKARFAEYTHYPEETLELLNPALHL